MKYNFELIQVARHLRSLSQKDVASGVGISQAQLSKAEHGLQGLTDEVMNRICSLLQVPISFFSIQSRLTPNGYYYYRKKLTISEKIINAFEAKIEIIKMIVDEIMTAVELPEYNLNSYNSSEHSPQEIADIIRHDLGISYGPIPNLTKLLENSGIIIIKIDFGTDKIDGITSVTASNRKIMFLNTRMPNDRTRFSLAHELGHLIMHISQTPQSAEIAEMEADLFASQLLMPEKEIKPYLQHLNGLTILSQLKRKYRVSMRSLIRKARDIDAISYQQYRNYQILFSKKGYTKREPIDLPYENPTLMSDTLKLYKEELGYSDSDIMQVMKINSEDYYNWFSPRTNVISLHKQT